MMQKTILITGGAGFIGINAARYFLQKQWRVIILDNLSRAGTSYNIRILQNEKPKNLHFEKADVVTDIKVLESLIRKSDVVLHLAAQVAVTTSIVNPQEDLNINIIGTFNVLEAIRKSKNRPILLFSSTNKVYGDLPQFPVKEGKTRYLFKDKKIQSSGISEDIQLNFHSPYGCSKGSADQYVIDYSRIYNLKTVVFRQSCIYGEHQMGIEDQGWVAWFAIAAILRKKITIFGSGKQVRDILYAGDLVRLYDLAINKIDKVSGEAFNVGGGVKNTLSLIECLDILSKKLDLNIKIVKDKIRAGDQPIFVSDNSKINKLLGWRPEVSVEVGLDKMVSWIKENLEVIEKSKSS